MKYLLGIQNPFVNIAMLAVAITAFSCGEAEQEENPTGDEPITGIWSGKIEAPTLNLDLGGNSNMELKLTQENRRFYLSLGDREANTAWGIWAVENGNQIKLQFIKNGTYLLGKDKKTGVLVLNVTKLEDDEEEGKKGDKKVDVFHFTTEDETIRFVVSKAYKNSGTFAVSPAFSSRPCDVNPLDPIKDTKIELTITKTKTSYQFEITVAPPNEAAALGSGNLLFSGPESARLDFKEESDSRLKNQKIMLRVKNFGGIKVTRDTPLYIEFANNTLTCE